MAWHHGLGYSMAYRRADKNLTTMSQRISSPSITVLHFGKVMFDDGDGDDEEKEMCSVNRF